MIICLYGNLSSTLLGNPIGGGELQLIYLAKQLSKNGHFIYIIDFECTDDFQYNNNLKILSFKRFIKNNNVIFKYYYLYKLLKLVNADVYHCRIRGWMHIIPFLASRKVGGIFSLGLASNLDVSSFYERYKYYYKYKGILYFLKTGFITELIFPYLFKNANIVFAQNSVQKNKLDKLKINNRLLTNIYSSENINSNNRKTASEDYFSYVGSLDRRKGFDIFLNLAQKKKNVQFKVVGNYRDLFASNYSSLQNVEFLGRLTHSETLSIISSSKALISTSRMEGFPNIFLEAWANGIPVISYAVNPNDLLSTRKLGYFCESDPKKLQTVISNFNKYNFSKKELIEYVIKNHNDKIITEKFIDIINNIKSLNKNL